MAPENYENFVLPSHHSTYIRPQLQMIWLSKYIEFTDTKRKLYDIKLCKFINNYGLVQVVEDLNSLSKWIKFN
jgi:hypothetical protein